MTLDIFEHWTRAVFLAQQKASNFELKSPTNTTLSERLLIVSKFGFPFGQ